MFVLSLKNGVIDPMRDSFNKYYMVLVEIKDFNALINNKPIFDQPAKKKKKKKKERERMKALLKCQETMIMLKEID